MDEIGHMMSEDMLDSLFHEAYNSNEGQWSKLSDSLFCNGLKAPIVETCNAAFYCE